MARRRLFSPSFAGRPSLPLRTLGGFQVWTDLMIRQGWRVQHCAPLDLFRLLDPDDRARAWGGYRHCLHALKQATPAPAADKDLVFVVHGYLGWRGHNFWMRRSLAAQGFAVDMFGYASLLGGLAEHAARLDRVLNRLAGVRSISFVTVSMGGPLLCEAMARNSGWRRRIRVNGVAMLAPPLNGTGLARLARPWSVLGRIAGRSAQQLTPAYRAPIAQLDAVPLLVVAGQAGGARGLNPLVDGPDDGVVGVASTWAERPHERLTTWMTHGGYFVDPKVRRTLLEFLSRVHPQPPH